LHGRVHSQSRRRRNETTGGVVMREWQRR
jgi:hypothetical protein